MSDDLLGRPRAAQDLAYRDTVLPPGIRARVSVAAGASSGWERIVSAITGIVEIIVPYVAH